jgi:hypothetical protein
MKDFSFDTTSELDLTRHLAKFLFDEMVKIGALVVREGSDSLALSALVSAVQPEVSLIYEAHRECLKGMESSPITQHLLKAYQDEHPNKSEQAAAVEVTTTLVTQAFQSTVRRVLYSVHPEHDEADHDADTLVSRVIVERTQNITPLGRVRVSRDAKGAYEEFTYYLTSGGTLLVRRPGSDEITEFESEVDEPFQWDDLKLRVATADEVKQARDLLLSYKLKARGQSEEERRAILSDPDPEGTGLPFKIKRVGSRLALGSEDIVEGIAQDLVLHSYRVGEVSASIVIKPSDAPKSVTIRLSDLAALPTPVDAAFLFVPIDDQIMAVLSNNLSSQITPIFNTASAETDAIMSLVSGTPPAAKPAQR